MQFKIEKGFNFQNLRELSELMNIRDCSRCRMVPGLLILDACE
jgi:hypothetical protein